jgi:hypothetical protein
MTSVFNLKDVLNFERIKTPVIITLKILILKVRGNFCQHIQCYSLESIINVFLKIIIN